MNARILTLVIATAVIAGAIGFHFGASKTPTAESGAQQTDSGERKVAYWVAPMDANYRRDEPGKSPMGMDLVPVYADEVNGSAGQDDADAVKLSPAVVQNFGVRTAKVKSGPFSRRIETVGYIDYDESLIAHLHMRAEGWVEKLYVHSIGERVEKGDLLFEIYAPALVNAQGDYLNALRSGRDELIRASKERLRALGIPDSQITEITKTRKATQRIRFFAPQDGVVAALNLAEGMYLTPQKAALSLADLAQVWLLVDVFETQAEWVKEGLRAQVRLSYKPGTAWDGEITYIYPQIDPQTRTLKARLEFDNPGEALKPGMYADVTIMGAEKQNVLSIPRAALIRTGNSERVILALGDGKFRPAAVQAGVESGDRVEIISGLEAGETVVTSAQFLIDSEASFSGTAIRMSDMRHTDDATGDHEHMRHDMEHE